MLTRRQFIGTLATAPLLPAPGYAGSLDTAAPPGELRIMTYNLRYAGTDAPPYDWPQRRPRIKALLDRYRPDLLGTQEGLYPQLRDLAADQPELDWIGLGREGGSHGEFTAIYYRRARFEPLEYDHFWLSDTPEVIGSSSWGNAVRRMVSWARFRDRVTSREFYFWNTHLDHEVAIAREKSARLISACMAALRSELPLFLVGDFNSVDHDNPAYTILTRDAGLFDTWPAARIRSEADANSFNGFGPLRRERQRIDWILARGALRVRATEAITWQPDGLWPSDHLPILAWITLTGP